MANQYTKKKQAEEAQAMPDVAVQMPAQEAESAAVDPAFAHALPGKTNAQIQAKMAELEALRVEMGLPKIEFGRDEKEKKAFARAQGVHIEGLSKQHETFDNALEDWSDLENDPLGLSDPLAAAKEKYGKPGIALKLLGAGISSHLGDRGYRPVVDERGQAVTIGKMRLGYMPEKYAQKRRDASIDDAKKRIRGVNDGMKEQIAKLTADARDLGLELVAPGDVNRNQHGMDQQAGISVERIVAS